MTDFQPTATVIADSISPLGVRLTTLEVTLHRFVLAQINTHRAFSRNSASSRAIPATRTIARLADQPAVPLVWPGERPGMQGGPPLPTAVAEKARETWLAARDDAVQSADKLLTLGVHKSIVNRLLEPFMSHTVIITATDWDNFFAQRLRPATGEPLAQAEIVAAALAMHAALTTHTPTRLSLGQWHLPYLDQWELNTTPLDQAKKVSVARCARVSYLTHEGKRSVEADLDLYWRLRHAKPPHWSPFEHVATPAAATETVDGNFTGWHQLRHLNPPGGVLS